jgi:tetratricopeptide (TPR) repeat protein
MRHVVLSIVVVTLIAGLPVHAAEQVRVAVVEATYVMGDSDTLAGAEEHVLLLAKRRAIEESGVYLEATSKDVETYAGNHTAHLNSLGIRTLAAAVTETEVLEKRRTLEGDRLAFYVRIRAQVHLDWLTEAVKRIRSDEQLAAHHRQLQAENSQLRAELDRLRRQTPGTENARVDFGQAKKNRRAAETLVRSAVQTRSVPSKIEIATRAIAEDDGYVDAYVIRGQTYLRMASLAVSAKGRWPQEPSVYIEHAIADFERALTLDHTSAWALLGRGDAYTWKGKLTEAGNDYNRILKLDPLFDVAQQRLIALYTGLAKKQVSSRDWQQALTSLERILDSNLAPSWVAYQKEAYVLRSQVYTELGDFGKAVADLTTVIRADPANAQAFLRRALLYRRLMQGRLAREDLEQACGLALEEACASL